MTVEALEFEQIVSLMVAGGAMGGIAHFFAQFRIKGLTLHINGETASVTTTFWQAFFSSITGIAGAMAIQFILILLGAFRSSAAPIDQIFILSISVAAGFGAKQILPQITESLMRKLQQVDEKATEAGTTSTRALEEVKKASDRIQQVDKSVVEKSMLYTLVANALRLKDTEDEDKQLEINQERAQMVDLLRVHIAKEPLLGAYRRPCGRLLKNLGRLNEAINEMDDFLKLRRAANQTDDDDFADVLFNKACYHALRWGQSHDAADKNTALELLRSSFDILPSNRDHAERDPDLDELRADPDWQQFVP